MSPIFDGNPTWSLDWLTFDPFTPDANGTVWILEDETGFFDGATPRLTSDTSALVEKVNRHGAMLGPNWMMERIITLKGKTFCESQDALSTALIQLSGICSDPNTSYRLTCHTNLGDLYANVRLDAQTQITPFAMSPSFQWSIQLIAPDPRKYLDQTFNAYISLPPATTGDGLFFSEAQNETTNPDFSSGTTGWLAYSTTTLTTGTAPGTPPPIFTTAATATSTAAGSNGLNMAMASSPTLDANANYVTASAYLYATTAKTVSVVLAWFDANSVRLREDTVNQALTASTWTQAYVTNTPPAGATVFRVEIRELAAASGSVFSASGVQLEYNNGPTPFTKTQSGLFFGDPSLTPNGALFGASVGSGQANLLNAGNAPAMPVYTLYGPLTTPLLTATDSAGNTATMRYNATLNAGDFVVVDPSAPSVMFDGSTSRRYLLNPANFGGFSVPAANMGTGEPGVLNVGLSHSGAYNSVGYCGVTYKYAYF